MKIGTLVSHLMGNVVVCLLLSYLIPFLSSNNIGPFFGTVLLFLSVIYMNLSDTKIPIIVSRRYFLVPARELKSSLLHLTLTTGDCVLNSRPKIIIM